MRLRTRVGIGAFAVAGLSLIVPWLVGATGFERALVAWAVAVGGAAVAAWAVSASLGGRVRIAAAAATRYLEGDLTRGIRDPIDDELGTITRTLDQAVHDLGRRLGDLATHRALTDVILSSMVEGVLVVGADGRVQMANDVVREMLGIGESPIGRHYIELVRHPELARHVTASLQGGAGGIEIRLHTQPPKRLLASASPFVTGRDRGLILVLHDVTDFRRADQIRQDFVANVSHELRTPLTAIRGAVDALADLDSLDAGRRFLAMIGRHTVRMERLVADLLRLARLDAGQEPLACVPCSVEALFSAVETELAAPLDARRQRVGARIHPDAAAIEADPAKLHDVMRNLLENAINYGPEGGAIELASAPSDDAVLLTVADRGSGIPDSDLGRIFERFYRVDRARARDPGGTGLGLSIVKHLVGLHGGTVQAANRPEGGAIFTIRLPRQMAKR